MNLEALADAERFGLSGISTQEELATKKDQNRMTVLLGLESRGGEVVQ